MQDDYGGQIYFAIYIRDTHVGNESGLGLQQESPVIKRALPTVVRLDLGGINCVVPWCQMTWGVLVRGGDTGSVVSVWDGAFAPAMRSRLREHMWSLPGHRGIPELKDHIQDFMIGVLDGMNGERRRLEDAYGRPCERRGLRSQTGCWRPKQNVLKLWPTLPGSWCQNE